MTDSSDDVSRIHNRYSLTLLTPSSYRQSLVMSLIIATLLVVTTVFAYLQSDDFLLRLGAVIGVLLVTQAIDSRFIKNKEYSKSLHMSFFGIAIWLLIAVVGLVAFYILSKEDLSLFFIAEGMFLFASFRIGLFTTVLGAKVRKALLLCFIQPVAIFLVLIPQDMWISTLLDPMVLGYGIVFLSVASVWAVLTDKAGRPNVKSTHKLVQAYLSSQQKDYSEIENIIEEQSNPSQVSTSQIRLRTQDDDSDLRLVLPEIHPGPYHPIGGSNIPYLIYKNLDSSAMVMHSVSDHALNLPSKQQVDNYLKSLADVTVSKEGLTCTEPVTVQVNKSRAVGLLFGKNALLFLSLSPHGMEDLPSYIKNEIEQFSKNRNFEKVMVVDCHNAMGKEISKIDSEDMIKAAKSCLETLITKPSLPLEFGYANSNEMHLNTPDLGLGGIGILCLKINGRKFFLGWADANNMENELREKIVDYFSKNGYYLLELCTSDTHFAYTKVRTKQGYYHFGSVATSLDISKWYLEIAKKAEEKIKPAKFEIIENKTQVKIMGPKIFEDYSKAMDKSLKLSKGFMIGCVAFFLTSLIL